MFACELTVCNKGPFTQQRNFSLTAMAGGYELEDGAGFLRAIVRRDLINLLALVTADDPKCSHSG